MDLVLPQSCIIFSLFWYIYSQFIPILNAKKKHIKQLKDGDEYPEEEHEMEQENSKSRVHTLSSSDDDHEDVMDTSQDLFGDFD